MEFVSIIQYLLPSVAIVMIAYWFINRPIRLAKLKMEAEAVHEKSKIITPLRLNAYERLVLFLERITPSELLNREMEADMSCFDLQMRLLNVIRKEYEHNVSQQIYVSHEAWQSLADAKNTIIQLVNMSATMVKPTEKAMKLAQIIITTYAKGGKTPTQHAIEMLKNEIENSD